MRANFSLDYDVVTVQQPTKVYLLARFESDKSITHRRPLNIGLVIDRSGSMSGSRIDYTRQAAQFLVQHLRADDILSIVLYNDKIETLLAPQKLLQKDQVNQRLDKIAVRGTTNLSGGWLEACAHVAKNKSDDYINRVILMSDGHANRGVTDPEKLVQMTQQKYTEEGIASTMMGLGEDFNEDLLMSMASAGGGAFYFIESPEVAPIIFNEELNGLLNVVGQNLSITIEPTDHVHQIKQLNAYGVDFDERNVSFLLGDIFADEIKTLVVELTIPALETLGEMQIANLIFEYDEITPTGTKHHRVVQSVTVNIAEINRNQVAPNLEVLQSVLLLQAANARKQAVDYADRGDYQTASKVLQDVVQAIDDLGLEDEYLREERNALNAQAERLAKGRDSYDEYSRKTMSTQAFYSMTNRHNDSVNLRTREMNRDNIQDVQDDMQDDDALLKRQTNMKANAPDSKQPDKVRTQEADMVTIFEDSSISQAAKSALDTDMIETSNGEVPQFMVWNDKAFALSGDLIRLGRATQNEIMIKERGISRFHAQIIRRDNVLYIEDLDSTNGIVIRGRRLRHAYRLSAGDEVFLCDEKLIFYADDPSSDHSHPEPTPDDNLTDDHQ